MVSLRKEVSPPGPVGSPLAADLYEATYAALGLENFPNRATWGEPSRR